MKIELSTEEFNVVKRDIGEKDFNDYLHVHLPIKREIDEDAVNDSNTDFKATKGENKETLHDTYQEVAKKRPRKRVYISSNKLPRIEPSKFFLPEHGRSLTHLLRKLVREQNWKQASGVLSTLLSGADQFSSPMENRKNYWAALEILSQIEGNCISPVKIRGIYEVWMSKHGWGAKFSMKKKYLIQLEYVLYHLMEGNIQEAHDTVKFLVLDSESGSDPLVNMMAGLIFYHLWYSSIPKEMQLRSSDMQMPSESRVAGSHDSVDVKPEHVEFSVDHDTEISLEVKNQYVSDGSIGNVRKKSAHISADLQTRQFSYANGFYMNESAEKDEQNGSPPNREKGFVDVSAPFPYGLDTSLLPIRVLQSTEPVEYSIYLHQQANKEHYFNAVKYLRVALYSTPPVLAALLPLIQLLLLGDQLEEAVEELKSFTKSSNVVPLLPLRLRASLLECFGRNNPNLLSTSYEDVLKNDPTCNHSLVALIKMYKNGLYNIYPLVEMIALHLDATYGTCDVWQELAECLLKLQTERYLCEENIMSTNWKENEASDSKSCSVSSVFPHLFLKDAAKGSWRLRCRWWSTRHFSKKARLSEIQAGDWQLLTLKAACASHLYGPMFEYVQSVYRDLEENNNVERHLFLQNHLLKSTKLLESLKGAI